MNLERILFEEITRIMDDPNEPIKRRRKAKESYRKITQGSLVKSSSFSTKDNRSARREY